MLFSTLIPSVLEDLLADKSTIRVGEDTTRFNQDF